MNSKSDHDATIQRIETGTRFVLLRECGHFSYLECPDEVRRKLYRRAGRHELCAHHEEGTTMTASLIATIPGTEVRTIKSRNVNQEYRVSVAVPYSYLSKPRKHYPGIYLLDANWYFGMVTELTRIMALCGRFPETIIVGIGYPIDVHSHAAFKQVAALRSRDLTPIVDRQREAQDAKELKVPRVRTGGARRFLQFIRTELIPVIEGEFRTNSTDRVLAGHSYGGLFVLYALFHQPKLSRDMWQVAQVSGMATK